MIDRKKYKNELKVLQKIRDNIPNEYNQIELLDYLFDDNIDKLISITSRSDGKTTNFLVALFDIAIKFEYRPIVIAPHDYIQRTLVAEFMQVIKNYSKRDHNNIQVINHRFAQEICYKGKTAMAFSNLDDALELKNNKEFLKQFRIPWFDEFIRFPEDYSNDEILKYQVIFETLEKDFEAYYPMKTIFTGNPLNFESPFLAEFELFDILENHPINTIKDYHYMVEDYEGDIEQNIALEINRNDKVNEKKSKNFFRSRNGSNSGEFQFNKFNLKKVDLYKGSYEYIIVQFTSQHYIYIYKQDNDYILSVKGYNNKECEFTFMYNNVTTHTKLVLDKFFKDSAYRRFTKNFYYFENAFTKNFFNENQHLQSLDFIKLLYTASSVSKIGVNDKKLSEMNVEEIEFVEKLNQMKRLNDLYNGGNF